ncbi:MAG: DUF4493 domain-containing protein [Muribaculaceae bacterium]|nr:DUF4493 domain-containing protein [Muribaculaceae bacterium]
MKLKVLKLLPIVMFAFASCGENDEFSKGAGTIDVQASIDSSVKSSITTRAISNAMNVELDSCTLSIVKADGTSAPFVGKFADYRSDMEIGVGTYDVTLEYGNSASEGFNRPYYYASKQVTVVDQQTTSLSLDAKLKNSMIVLEFSEAFEMYFTSYEITLQSSGNTSVVWSAGENRAAYLRPGAISMKMKLSSVTGKEVTVDAPAITAEEGILYNVSLDVNEGEIGKTSISISFNDETVQQPINIEINDDIVDAEAPLIQVVGFESGQSINVIEGEGAELNPKFHIIATAGIEEVWLTTTGDYLLGQGMPQQVNLAGELPAETIAKLNSLGLITKGLLSGKDKMAVVDLSGLVKNLRANSNEEPTTFSVKVKDAYGRWFPEEGNPEPELVVDVDAIHFEATDAENIPVGEKSTSFFITTNGKSDELMSSLKITALNTDGLRTPVEILNIEPQESPENTYKVSIQLPLRNSDPQIQCAYRDAVIVPVKSIGMEYSEAQTQLIGLETTQNRAIVRVLNAEIMRFARVAYVNGKEISIGADMRNDVRGEILIADNAELKPSNGYEVAVSFLAIPSKENAPKVTVNTKAVKEVPNGDFEDLDESVERTNMKEGGQHRPTVASSWLQNTQTFVVRKPEGWSTTNPITASDEAINQNSWFVIPSVYNTTLTWLSSTQGLEGGNYGKETATPDVYKNLSAKSGSNAMVIRNVAYDLSGVLPSGYTGTGLGSTAKDYYNHTAPSAIASRMAGRLMLGAGGNGTDFSGTPKSLKLWYIFKESTDAGETGTIEIQLLSQKDGASEGKVVATGSANLPAYASSSDYTQVSVPIVYSDMWNVPDKLKIVIRSSNRNDADVVITNHISLHEQSAYGAQLFVDALTFEY